MQIPFLFSLYHTFKVTLLQVQSDFIWGQHWARWNQFHLQPGRTHGWQTIETPCTVPAGVFLVCCGNCSALVNCSLWQINTIRIKNVCIMINVHLKCYKTFLHTCARDPQKLQVSSTLLHRGLGAGRAVAVQVPPVLHRSHALGHLQEPQGCWGTRSR